jgi:hypothetical protein
MFRWYLVRRGVAAILLSGSLSFLSAAQLVSPIAVKDVTGSQQQNRPTSVFMTFKRGDVPHFAQAVIGSVPILTQCDVRTRWPDGSLKQATVSFVYTIPASSSVTVSFQDQATGNNTGYLSKTDLLARPWDAEVQTVASSVTKTADARTILTAAASISTDPNSLGVRYWLQGSVVTQVILEDRTSARSSDFGYTCTQNCTVNLASTAVNTSTGAFTATGHTMQNGSLVTIYALHEYNHIGSPPTGFTNGSAYYVVQADANTFKLSTTSGGSPIVPSDQGSGIYLPATPIEIGGVPNGTAVWATDTTHKSLHPTFVLTFFAGYTGGIKVDYILSDDWTTHLQDQRYALTLLGDSGNGTTKYSHAEFPHYAMTRWRKTYWSGTALGDVKIDHNFAYLTSTGIIPNYDTSGTVTAANINADTTNWNANTFGGISNYACDPTSQVFSQTFVGGFPKAMGTTGQTTADYIGIIPAWQVRWLYGMSNAAVDNTQFNGPTMSTLNCSGLVPVHLWESDTGRWYDSGHTIDAFGLPISIDARPTIYFNSTTGSDDIAFVAPRTTYSGWDFDTAHQPGHGFFQYLMTGDWYALQELYAWNSFNPTQMNIGKDTCGRAGAWGNLNDGGSCLQTRAKAWSFRGFVQTAASAPDNSPEKAYFTEKINNNIVISEGRYAITNGAFPPSDPTCAGFNAVTTTDKWCFGNKMISEIPYEDTPRYSTLHVPTNGTNGSCNGTWNQNYDANATCDSTWHQYFYYAALGHAKDLGFSTNALLSWIAKDWINMVVNPAFNPYLIDQNYMVMMGNSKTMPTNWGGSDATGMKFYLAGSSRSFFANSGNPSTPATPGPSDYANIFKGMVTWAYAYTDGSYTGSGAWAWVRDHVPNTGANGDHKWDFLPRYSPCDLNEDGLVNILDVQNGYIQFHGTCGNADLTGDGLCTIVDIQRLIDAAALGGTCRVGP